VLLFCFVVFTSFQIGKLEVGGSDEQKQSGFPTLTFFKRVDGQTDLEVERVHAIQNREKCHERKTLLLCSVMWPRQLCVLLFKFF
jgi:hypothetical protein